MGTGGVQLLVRQLKVYTLKLSSKLILMNCAECIMNCALHTLHTLSCCVSIQTLEQRSYILPIPDLMPKCCGAGEAWTAAKRPSKRTCNIVIIVVVVPNYWASDIDAAFPEGLSLPVQYVHLKTLFIYSSIATFTQFIIEPGKRK